MGGSASKPDPSEDKIKHNNQVPLTLVGIAGIFVEESNALVSTLASLIESKNVNDQELHDVVDHFFSHSNCLSAFCNEIESCLNKARDSHLNLRAAVQRFKEGRGDGANGSDKYKGAFEELEKFKNSENPFTGLPEILKKVRQQQQELQKNIENYNKKIEEEQSKELIWRIAKGCILATTLIAFWAGEVYILFAGLFLKPLADELIEHFDSYYDELKRHQGLIGSMMAQGLIERNDLNEIETAATKIKDQLQSLKKNAEFTLEGEEKVKIGFEQIEKKIDHYAESIDQLGECIEKCSKDLRKGREAIKKVIEKKI